MQAASPYIAKVFCGECGHSMKRLSWASRGVCFWKCECRNRKIDEKILDRAFVIAWNAIVDQRDEYMPLWEKMIKEGNPLGKLRGKQMVDLTAEGRIAMQIPEHTTMVLESMIMNNEAVTVGFLDGTMREIVVY